MGSKAERSGVEQNGVMEWSEFCNKPENFFKLHLAYLHNFLWTRALKSNQFVEIKQFFKVDIKQNSVSTVIWLIKFVVYQWSRSAPSGGSRVVYIFVYITKSVFSLTSNHIKIIMLLFILIISNVHTDLSSLPRKPNLQIEDEFINIMN